jgi:exonuclease SbcC
MHRVAAQAVPGICFPTSRAERTAGWYLMVLKRFLRPKWQHPRMEVRKRAVEELPADEVAILLRIAHEDAAPELRRLALGRINLLGALGRAAAEDGDASVREFARQRYRQLLAGEREGAPELDERLSVATETADEDLLEYVARKATEAELRAVALGRVARESVLAEATAHDPEPANRLLALERISRKTTLEAVIRESRMRDKQVTRRARERLEEMERPERVRAQCQSLCTRIEELAGRERWDQDYTIFRKIESDWQALESEAEEGYRKRFAQARSSFASHYEQQRAARQERERHYVQSRESAARILDVMEGMLDGLQQRRVPATEEEAELRARLAALEAEWDAVTGLPESEVAMLRSRYADRRAAIDARLATLHRSRNAEQTLQRVCEQSRGLLEQQRPVSEREVKALERRWQPGAGDIATEELERLERVLVETRAALRDRLARQREERDTGLGELPGVIDRLEAALAQGRLKHAVPLHDQIHTRLRNLGDMGAPADRLAPLRKRLNAVSPQVRALRKWRKWGGDRVRERLCADVEALEGADLPPAEIARRIQAARTEWKGLASSAEPGSDALWERFQSACESAYKPCRAYYEELAKQRQANLESRRDLCRQLEDFLEQAEWAHVDWKNVVRMERRLLSQWRQAGPVDRKERKSLERRFKTALSVLQERLALERERNLRQRTALIERIEALQEAHDPDQAVEECKRLQKEWVTTVPGRRGDENALWERYRAARDGVFARRSRQHAEEVATLRHNLEIRQALCARLEALLTMEPDAIQAAQQEVHRIQSEWEGAGPAPKREAQEVERRFSSSLRRFEAHLREARKREEDAQLELMRRRAQLCTEIETMLGSGDAGTAATTRLGDVRGRWEALPALRDKGAAAALQARFEQACKAVLEGEPWLTQFRQMLGANQRLREDLCLHMEVLAGVESPPEFSRARMEYQVKLLSRALDEGLDDKGRMVRETEQGWYLAGPAKAGPAEELEARFNRALAASRQRGER